MSSIKALTCDTGGTILDWHSGISAKLAETGKRRGIEADWSSIANDYRRKSLMAMTGGDADFQPNFNIDDVHRRQIEIVSKQHELHRFTDADFDEIRDAWHGLKCWPDVPDGMARLRRKYIVASLTILSFRLIIDSCKPAGIVWDAVLSCEAIGHYKMRPQPYLTAAKWLQLEPPQCLMVAAHPADLMAASRIGYKTALINRRLEWGPRAGHPRPEMTLKPTTPSKVLMSLRLQWVARQLGRDSLSLEPCSFERADMFAKMKLRYEALPLPDRTNFSDREMQVAADAFYDRIRRRHTIRDFSDRPVALPVIESCIRAAGTSPSGANHQPWHFVAIANRDIKNRIRLAAEEEEREFYAGGAGDEWIKALEPIGTTASKPHLDVAPWLIVVFAQRWGSFDDGTRFKNYYVPESVGIATGFLLAALHHAGLSTLTHTPNPMKFLNALLGRPASEKPLMILAVGHPAKDATVPAAAKIKKPLGEILTVKA